MSAPRLTGDRAIKDRSEDRLGYRPVATRIAASLIEHASENGLVVGIEGPWGSGKSSLLFLVEDELKAAGEDLRPTVINFRPWLIRERDSLLPALFREITLAIDGIYQSRGDATRASLTKAKDAALAARRFAKAIGRAGDLVQLAGDFSALPPVKWGGKALKAGGEFFGKTEPVSPSTSKDKLVSALRELGQTIVVTIDDVDRLEPREAFEVLRLVRSVADFPNVIYLLCYDSKILAESVQKIAGVEDGQHFLEKIVQLTVIVPTPEPFQLRNWFTEELKEIGVPDTDKGLERLKEVINWDGGRRLKSPRSVVRALDSIRFIWPALEAEGADFSDLVWLQLIKNDNLALYRWVEDYLSNQSVIALQIGQVDKADRERAAKELERVDHGSFFDSMHYRHHFAEQLPGIDADYVDGAAIPKIYQKVAKDDQDQAIADKRLSSPDHYRLYFSFAAPSHTIPQGELHQFWEALEGPPGDQVASFLHLHDQIVLGTFSKADVLLERLDAANAEGLSVARSRNLLRLFSNVMDAVYRVRPFDRFWVNSTWDRAQRLIPRLLSMLGDERHQVVEEMFVQGDALSWLTDIFRKETFAHGRYGDRKKPQEEWYLTDPEFDAVANAMIERYRGMSVDDLITSIDPVNILYAWLQGGDEAGAQGLATAAAQSDDGLVSLLEAMRGKVTSTAGRYYVLKRSNLDPFLNYDDARARTEAIADNEDRPELAERAKGLIRDFRFGDNE
jgi:hypothetical protein